MGLGPLSHGSYLFIIGPMGAFVFFALGCLDGEVQTTNILWTGKSADSLVGNESFCVYHRVLSLLSQFLKTDRSAAKVELNRRL